MAKKTTAAAKTKKSVKRNSVTLTDNRTGQSFEYELLKGSVGPAVRLVAITVIPNARDNLATSRPILPSPTIPITFDWRDAVRNACHSFCRCN